MLTANSPADYGNVNGGGVVSILKSGTNHIHGSAYGYVQDYRFNANSWANDHADPSSPSTRIRNRSSAARLGGPVIHNKLFFFVDYLGSRYHTAAPPSASVFTAAMRNGDFSALVSRQQPHPVVRSAEQLRSLRGQQGRPRQQPGRKVPVCQPVALPAAQCHSVTTALPPTTCKVTRAASRPTIRATSKLSGIRSANDKLTGFYSMSTAYDGQTALLGISFPGHNLYPTKLSGANWVHIFSPALVNSARIGFTRTVWAQNFPSDPTGQFGTKGNAKVGIPFPNQSFDGYSYQSISGGITAGGTNVYGGGLIDNTYSYIDNLTWTRGKHTISMGVQALRYENNYPTANNYGYLGQLVYSGHFTSNPALSNAGWLRRRRLSA